MGHGANADPTAKAKAKEMFRGKYRHLKAWVHPKTGKVYVRFVRKGYPSVQLHGTMGSPEFDAAYHAALNGVPFAVAPIGASRSRPGSVNAVVALYLQHESFLGKHLSESTRRQRRPILDRFREQYGIMAIALMHRPFIEKALSSLAPHAARNWVKALRPLMEFAVKQGLCEIDPTAGIKTRVPKSEGHATWTEVEIAQFRSHFAIGTMERLAMELALNTGQRGSDLVRMGRQHIRNGVLKIKQQKTGMEVEVPVHPDLAAVIAATPASNLTFLANGWGKQFTPNGFSFWFSTIAQQAGMPVGYTAHGLRKGCCKRLADMGCSVTEIAAISGHVTLSEIQRYTAAYDRRKAAGSAIAKLIAGEA